jgi:hypothetical protein
MLAAQRRSVATRERTAARDSHANADDDDDDEGGERKGGEESSLLCLILSNVGSPLSTLLLSKYSQIDIKTNNWCQMYVQ